MRQVLDDNLNSVNVKCKLGMCGLHCNFSLNFPVRRTCKLTEQKIASIIDVDPEFSVNRYDKVLTTYRIFKQS